MLSEHSAVFVRGKLSKLKLLDKHKIARESADMFLKPNSTIEAVGNAGTK